MEDIRTTAGAHLAGMPLGEVRERYTPQAQILVLQAGAKIMLSPGSGLILGAGDTLAVIGTKEQLAALEHAVSS